MIRASMLLLPAILLAILVGASCGTGEPGEVEIPVEIQGGKLIPETIKVTQDDTITLKITTEHPGEFHIHTYDIQKNLETGDEVDLIFVANAAGRLRITFHEAPTGEEGHEEEGHEDEEGEEVDIGFFEVGPR